MIGFIRMFFIGRRRFSVTFVLNFGDETGVAIDVVVDSLPATVREDDPVIAGGLVTNA